MGSGQRYAIGDAGGHARVGDEPAPRGVNQAPAMLERQVIEWFSDGFGMRGASGLFATGWTMANVYALACARVTMATRLGRDVRQHGVQSWPGETPVAPMVCYGSKETHGWAHMAAEWLGLGDRAFRQVPTSPKGFTVDVAAVAAMIEADRAAGLVPFVRGHRHRRHGQHRRHRRLAGARRPVCARITVVSRRRSLRGLGRPLTVGARPGAGNGAS